MKKILLIQLRKMGDVITTTPAVRQLRKEFSNSQIDFLTENLGANIYKYDNNISNLISIPYKIPFVDFIKLIKKIKEEKYDIIIDFFSNPKSAQICKFSNCKNTIGYKKGLRDFAYKKIIDLDKKIDDKYFYTPIHKLFLLEDLFNPNFENTEIEFKISDKEQNLANDFCKKNNISKNKTVALCVVSERQGAKVPNNIYIKIANKLIKKGKNIFFVYGPNEKEQILEVYNEINDKSKVIIDYKMTSILENRAILENCNFYLGNDGGTKHISITAGIPTFTLFYKDKSRNWTPPNDKKHIGIQFLDNEKELTLESTLNKLENFLKNNQL